MDKVFVIMSKIIQDIWLNFWQIWATLGKSFEPICTYPNQFGQNLGENTPLSFTGRPGETI